MMSTGGAAVGGAPVKEDAGDTASAGAVAPGLRGPVTATALLFVANGAIFGAIVPRLPDLKDALDLGPAAFGLAMACYPAGALIGGLFAPALMRRHSDGAVAVATMCAASLVAALVGFSPVVAVFAGLMLLFGLCDALTDVSMNAHGIRVQLQHGQSLINRFHALWSLGAVLGAAGGSVAAGAGFPVRGQMIGAGVVCCVAVLAAYPLRLGGSVTGDELGRDLDSERAGEPRAAAPHRRIPGGRALLVLVALGVLASCAAVVEDFAQTWSALHLREVAAAGAGLAGLGFIAVQGAQLIGRLTGDRLVDGFGAAHVGRMGGACVVAGSGAALVASHLLDGPALLAVLLAGFALAGWGIATVIPGAMVGADRVPGLTPGTGLAVLNWVMRVGFLTSPPLVGLIAEHAGMRWTVVPVLVGGVVIAVLAGPLLGRNDRPGHTFQEVRA
ncbi:MFS transporter [Rhodococcus sp. IEGM 1408]|uniref:MFS transporter n=1 Tax=Rhodococcus sp. IEGM 1408 TaxID=3082220 RepID=UPI00295469FA|nr:MFS transporter [Rhodococcus sp. IEGM 1408]MDV7999640.1 MFS transporter [Rhodococcus sp. IEGM 1408]